MIVLLSTSLKCAQDDALGDGLFVGKPALAQTRDDVGQCGFEGHSDSTGRIDRRRLCPRPPATASANHPHNIKDRRPARNGVITLDIPAREQVAGFRPASRRRWGGGGGGGR